MDTPPAVQRMIDATNRGDHDAFVAAFTEDAYLEDWGRGFHGHEGVAGWDASDNIGRQAHFEAAGTREEDGRHVVTMIVTGGGFNGTSDITFEIDGDRIRRMIIAAGLPPGTGGPGR
jgi:hypothetical protein